MTASMKAIVSGRSTSRPRDRTAVAKTSAAIGNTVQTKAKPSVVSGLAAAVCSCDSSSMVSNCGESGAKPLLVYAFIYTEASLVYEISSAPSF